MSRYVFIARRSIRQANRQPTKFEKRVYAVVRRIPKGQTRSYLWVAQQLGNAVFARSVGRALSRNPWPGDPCAPASKRTNARKLVPCHRVIRSDGTLGGYSEGVPKKRFLLRKEGIISS